ncbi:kelch-like protein 41 [Neocloeon triangulifer]|uniref:kelch-like protein 41 n=1 Tax=Neocloeon triangulifer TaxID=2078957 RepID=UPI00286EFA7F|nr:kelch-like protein 41 [Neocloeon triangulifer]
MEPIIKESNSSTSQTSQSQIKNDRREHTADFFSNCLHFYESSWMYDCTIRVGALQGSQPFKCHKLILSAASGIFYTMFNSQFKEAQLGPDDAILIEDALPEIFNAAMRFVYGRKADFGDEITAARLYQFAHKWQIQSLLEATDLFLREPLPENVAFVYDVFKLLRNEEGLKRCMKVIKMKTPYVIKSPYWENVSLETVMDVLGSNTLSISNECSLLEALVLWGMSRVKTQGGPLSGEEVRKAIDEPLKWIRFLTMDQEKFTSFCLKCSSLEILTAKESMQIFMSLSTKNDTLLPEKFSHNRDWRFSLDMATWVPLPTSLENDYDAPCYLEFSVSADVFFVGFRFLDFHDSNYHFKPDASFELCSESGKICEGTTKKDFDPNLYCCLVKPHALVKDVKYKIFVHYYNLPEDSYSFQVFVSQFVTDENITVSLSQTCSMAGICSLIFWSVP